MNIWLDSGISKRRLLTWPSKLNCIGINLEGQFEVETLGSLDQGTDAETAIMVAEVREMAKQMARHRAAREEMEAEFEAYRSRPWWRRIAS